MPEFTWRNILFKRSLIGTVLLPPSANAKEAILRETLAAMETYQTITRIRSKTTNGVAEVRASYIESLERAVPTFF